MDHEDPVTQFFPGQESVDLYDVLLLTNEAKLEDIKKSYRRLALIYHPDKHATAGEAAKAGASARFQQIGFAYAVLSDEERRNRYDNTGRTDEGFELAAGDDGWEAYFEEMFERVTRGKLDEMKKEYQGLNILVHTSLPFPHIFAVGSNEEIDDLKTAYADTKGHIGDIMTYIPHSTHEDEARFIVIISDLISKGDLPSLFTWESSIKDEKSKLVRKKQGEKEAKEAEKLAKELGVWDEFYGSGRAGERKGKGKGKETDKRQGGNEEDHSALQALILKKRKNMDGFFDDLAAKYAEPGSSSKSRGQGKKRAKAVDEDEEESESPKKRSRRAPPSTPEINDDEFEKLQQKLFGDKAKASPMPTESKLKRSGKGRKAK